MKSGRGMGVSGNGASFCPLAMTAMLRLGEVDTPLIDIPVAAKMAGATGRVIVKDESRLPTASFKARGLALGVSMAKSFGLKRLAMPTAGNAGGGDVGLCAARRDGGLRLLS